MSDFPFTFTAYISIGDDFLILMKSRGIDFDINKHINDNYAKMRQSLSLNIRQSNLQPEWFDFELIFCPNDDDYHSYEVVATLQQRYRDLLVFS